MTTKIKTERKFGNKIYTLAFASSVDMYGQGVESIAKQRAEKEVKELREEGLSACMVREIHIKYPPKGPEVFWVVYARKEGITLEQVSKFIRNRRGIY
jgi:hypothetical protein